MGTIQNMNWIEISNKMRRPSWAFDVRSIVDPKEIINSGINFGELVMVVNIKILKVR